MTKKEFENKISVMLGDLYDAMTAVGRSDLNNARQKACQKQLDKAYKAVFDIYYDLDNGIGISEAFQE